MLYITLKYFYNVPEQPLRENKTERRCAPKERMDFMPDMLVHLLKLPELSPLLAEFGKKGVSIQRAMAPDMRRITAWVMEHFGSHWASECEVCFSRQPVSCFIAVKDKDILGFSCYEATNRNFFGPIGVLEEKRSLGIGRGLLFACLHGMREMGYAYAVIGGAGPTGFYEKTVNAAVIPDSVPGVFKYLLDE